MKKFFIGIDSDGCVFDSMEVKHKECFCPAFVNVMGLQGVSRYAREVWEFVNLYSRTRGINRFMALTMSIDLLKDRKEIGERNIILPELSGLKEWITREPKLGMAALEKEMARNNHPDLQLAWKWSCEVNENVKKIFRGVHPFSAVKKTLEKAGESAEINVISQTPVKNIVDEWTESGIAPYADLILGQETGSKSAQLALAVKGKYDENHGLMIGDAPGDFEAARENGILFFPIIPGREEESWEELCGEGLDRFLEGSFRGAYGDKLYSDFLKALPEKPHWS